MYQSAFFITVFFVAVIFMFSANAQETPATATAPVVAVPAAPVIETKEDKGPPVVGRKPPHDAITGEIVTDEKQTAYDPFKDDKKDEESLRDRVRAKLKD